MSREKDMPEIKYLENHECIENKCDIAIEKYQTDEPKWMFRIGHELYRILYCPYCGEKLN